MGRARANASTPPWRTSLPLTPIPPAVKPSARTAHSRRAPDCPPGPRLLMRPVAPPLAISPSPYLPLFVSLLLLATTFPAQAADLRYFEDAALNAVQFIDDQEGWTVGEDGVI